MRYFLLLCILAFSSFTFAQKGRKLYQQQDVIIFDTDSAVKCNKSVETSEKKDVETPKSVETNIESRLDEKKNNEKNEKGEDTIRRKDVYNIALILPFSADAGWGSMAAGIKEMTENGIKKWNIPKETKISIDFYNGVRMAIANLNNAKVSTNLRVFDDKKNEDVTKEILKDSSMKTMDIIIGPAHTQNAKLVADFCKENHIYNFSPLSTSKYVTIANPYHFKLAPSLDMHLKAMVDYFVKKYNYGSILVMCRPTDEDRSFAATVYDYVAKLNLTKAKNEQLFCDTLVSGNESSKKAISTMYTGNHTFVLVPSFNEAFINSALDKVAGKSDKVDLFGFPSWTEYDNVNYASMNNDEPILTKVSFGDTANVDVKTFIKNFRDAHGYYPEENNYLGYDVMMFTADVLRKFGLSIKENYTKIDYQGIGTHFTFVPVKYSKFETGSDLDMYENNQLNFLKFQNFDLIPLENKK